MANTGYKGWTTLEQYWTDNGAATGTTKANTEGQADYIAPVYDTDACSILHITLDTYGVTIDFLNQYTVFHITSNYSYYDIVSSDSSWLTSDISSGGGNSTVTVHATKNVGVERYAEINIVDNGVILLSFAVTQGQ